MKRILYFAVIWICISTVSHAVQPAPETIAESEKTLFGKLKLWEIEKISPHLYAYRYTFYRNFFLIGEDGIILTDPLTDSTPSLSASFSACKKNGTRLKM